MSCQSRQWAQQQACESDEVQQHYYKLRHSCRPHNTRRRFRCFFFALLIHVTRCERRHACILGAAKCAEHSPQRVQVPTKRSSMDAEATTGCATGPPPHTTGAEETALSVRPAQAAHGALQAVTAAVVQRREAEMARRRADRERHHHKVCVHVCTCVTACMCAVVGVRRGTQRSEAEGTQRENGMGQAGTRPSGPFSNQ